MKRNDVELQQAASEIHHLSSAIMSLQYSRDKPFSDVAVADAGPLQTQSPSRSGKVGPSRLQWLVIISVCLAGGWFLANALYTPKEVITVKLDQDTTKALGAFLHGEDETHLGTSSELAVRGLGELDLAQLDKRALNPFATFTSGNAVSKVRKSDSCRSLHIGTFRTSGRSHCWRCRQLQHGSQQL
jgi:hypothetical protein